MKQSISIIIVIALFSFGLQTRAQFFEFGYPRNERRQEPQETVEPAQYKGGTAGLNRFLEKEFKRVPEKSDVEGNIIIACIIGEKGKVTETQVLRSLGTELDNEALRVVKKLKFKPAKQGKKAVKSRINISFPIRRGKVSFSTLKTIDV